MRRTLFAITSALIVSSLAPNTAWTQETVVVAVPARAGAVDGTTENSDDFMWRLFAEQIAAPAFEGHPSPAKFETWASDADTFSPDPHWPTPGEPIQLHTSVLEVLKTFDGSGSLKNLHLKIDV